MGVREHACFPGKILTFFHSLQRYFTYFRTRFDEKLQPQKAIFMSPNVVRSKKNIFSCKTLYTNTTAQYNTHEYNRKIAPCLCFWRVNYIVIKNWTLNFDCCCAHNSSSNVLSTTTGIFYCKLLHLLFGVLRILGTLMEWNRRQSHDCSELFWLHQFSSRGRQNRTRHTAHFHVIGNGSDRLCSRSNAHCIECYFEVLTYRITWTYFYYMLFERQGLAKALQKHT
jgi:hypothetical protein